MKPMGLGSYRIDWVRRGREGFETLRSVLSRYVTNPVYRWPSKLSRSSKGLRSFSEHRFSSTDWVRIIVDDWVRIIMNEYQWTIGYHIDWVRIIMNRSVSYRLGSYHNGPIGSVSYRLGSYHNGPIRIIPIGFVS